jgi:pimeloyl-ACP methyl ester carboxylesterase
MKPPSIPAIPPLWRESRVPLELASLVRDPVYKGVGVEDAHGQPVLLIPGFLAGDDTLGLMTQWLRRTGHRTRKAAIRTNIDCSEVSVQRLEERIEMMVETHRQKVAIVGQSRGGTLAKVLGVRRPDLVSGVVALGAPIVDPLGVHPLVRMQVYAVGTLLGRPREADAARRRLPLDLLEERRNREMARLPRPVRGEPRDLGEPHGDGGASGRVPRGRRCAGGVP